MNTAQAKLNGKLQITLNQWIEKLKKELAYSVDLQKTEEIEQAKLMIEKIKGMMA